MGGPLGGRPFTVGKPLALYIGVPICVSPWGAQPAHSRTNLRTNPHISGILINDDRPFGFGMDKADVSLVPLV